MMQPDEIVDLLAGADGETIRVRDEEGEEWQAYVDDVSFTPKAVKEKFIIWKTYT